MLYSATSNLLRLFLVVTISLVFAGCEDSHEKATKDMLSLINRIADVVESVKDKSSAEAAKVKLRPLIAEMKALKAQTDRLGEPQNSKELDEKYGKDMDESMRRMNDSLLKAVTTGPDSADGLKELIDALKSMRP